MTTFNTGISPVATLDPPASQTRIERNSQTLRIALLGDCAVQQFVSSITAQLRSTGFSAELFQADFGAVELTAYDGNSALYSFSPDYIVILNATQALRGEYYARTGSGTEFLDSTLQRMERIWNALQRHSNATIIQSNFVPPYERLFGNYDQKHADSLYSVVTTLNVRLAEASRSYAGVLINDVDAIASTVGRASWFDERFWFLAKTFCAADSLPLVARNLTEIMLAGRGRVVKCVVLDLDNTLWGGIIGDDGLNGIAIAPHGDGQAFHHLQSFLLELTRRGIILAVCSKNDHANAIEPFEKHPDMVLRSRHITEFVANWDDKATNIRLIRERLNIGLDSMVFLDDNPFERNLVRELLPDVIVPELPEDPSEYLSSICALNLFETSTFSKEDLNRAGMYRVEAARRAEEASYGSAEDFLDSLDMRISVERWDSFHLPRIAQLIQRSNQYNLTTRRLSEPECAAMMRDPERWLTLQVSLKDRLGDHGLISVVACERLGEELAIRDWLMSCRVLKRTVEQYVMLEVFSEAARLGLKRVTGTYVPTLKNSMVKDFFCQFGFHRIACSDDLHPAWTLDLAEFVAPQTYIKAAEADSKEGIS